MLGIPAQPLDRQAEREPVRHPADVGDGPPQSDIVVLSVAGSRAAGSRDTGAWPAGALGRRQPGR